MSENALAPMQKPAGIVPADLTQAVQFAKMMSDSSLVPKHLQGKPADCFLVVEQASRWGMSPFAVAQCTSVISGKLMFEGKLVTAVVNALAGLVGGLDFVYSGEGDNRTCTAIGKKPEWAEARSVAVVLKDVRTANDMWRKQPDQQLCYSAARNWARRFAPEVMLGVYSPEEMEPEYIPPTPANDAAKAAVARGGNSPKRSTAKEAPPAAEAPKDAPVTSHSSEQRDSASAPGAPEIGHDQRKGSPSHGREHGSDDGDVTDDQETVPTWIYDDARADWLVGPPSQKRTNQQNKVMWALIGELGMGEAERKAGIKKYYNKDSSEELSVDEMDDMIDRLRRRVHEVSGGGRRAQSVRRG